MNISELIEILACFMKQHGDVLVQVDRKNLVRETNVNYHSFHENISGWTQNHRHTSVQLKTVNDEPQTSA